MMKCDIIIPIWNQLSVTRDCLNSIIQNTQYPFRLILIDNGSDKLTKAYLERFRDVHQDRVILIRNRENLGFVIATNQGLKQSDSPFVCMLNNDTIVTRGWLSALISILENYPKIGIINPTWQCAEGKTPQERADRLASFKGQFLEVSECMGFCIVIRREVIEKVGYLDESFGMGGLDDSDYSKRVIMEGYLCARAKDTYVHHLENTTFDTVQDWQSDRHKKTEIYEKKWGKTKHVVFIFDDFHLDEEMIVERLRHCLTLARVGLRQQVWFFLSSKSLLRSQKFLEEYGILEHNYLKYDYFGGPRAFFPLHCFVMLMSRRHKRGSKRFHAVIVENLSLYRFLRLLQPIHHAMVYKDVNECSLIEKERERGMSSLAVGN